MNYDIIGNIRPVKFSNIRMVLVFHMMNVGLKKMRRIIWGDITSQFNIKTSLNVEYETVNCFTSDNNMDDFRDNGSESVV